MKRIQVCLVSDQPIPNLTTAIQFQPDTVVLLYTDDKKSQKERLEKVLCRKGVQVDGRVILPYGLENVIGVCESIIQSCADCEVSLNITGGTKIGTIGAFQAFYSAGFPIYYVNTRDNEIVQVSPEERTMPLAVRIPIREYLAVYGFSVESTTTDYAPIMRRKAATGALRNLAITSEQSIGNLNRSFPLALERAAYPLETGPLDPATLALAPTLKECGIARAGKNGGLRVNSIEDANYLRGFWFEECVYLAAREAGADEVALNVFGQWDAAGKRSPKNEFDVMIGKGNRLFFISCKTKNPNVKLGGEGVGKEYLYELDSLGDHALGLFGRKMLASARPITDEYVKKRARVMGIQMLDRNDLANLKGKIREWLNG